jgi:hypothetical protein
LLQMEKIYFLKTDQAGELPIILKEEWLIIYLLSLYLSVKGSHHIRREGLEIPTVIQKREEYTPFDFMKIRRSESIFNTNPINKYINLE